MDFQESYDPFLSRRYLFLEGREYGIETVGQLKPEGDYNCAAVHVLACFEQEVVV
jgi:hypothetical protein